jgi:hypothetical protein
VDLQLPIDQLGRDAFDVGIRRQPDRSLEPSGARLDEMSHGPILDSEASFTGDEQSPSGDGDLDVLCSDTGQGKAEQIFVSQLEDVHLRPPRQLEAGLLLFE